MTAISNSGAISAPTSSLYCNSLNPKITDGLLSISPSGNWKLYGCKGHIQVRDSNTNALYKLIPAHTRHVTRAVFSPDEENVFASYLDGRVKLWRISDTTCLLDCQMHEKPISSLAVSSDGKQALSSAGSSIVLWDLETGERKLELSAKAESLALSPDGSTALSGSWGSLDHGDGFGSPGIHYWDLKSGELLRSFSHLGQVTAVAYSPDGEQALSGSSTGTITLWDLKSYSELFSLHSHPGLMSAAFSPDGCIHSGSATCIKIWKKDFSEEDFKKATGPLNVLGQIKLLFVPPPDGFAAFYWGTKIPGVCRETKALESIAIAD